MKIAVDLMGGDRAPESIISGVAQALEEKRIDLILVGDRDTVAQKLEGLNLGKSIRIHHSSQIAGMDEDLSTVLKKKTDSSILSAFKLVRRGEAKAVISAGSSMATIAAGLHVLGMIRGVKRPALAACFQTELGKSVILDLGSNVDCTEESLVQFAHMGSSYAKVALRIEKPKVALISNGHEDIKGNKVTRATNAVLKEDRKLNYTGFIEASQIYSGVADVIVCDGFVGNAILKSSEGVVNAVLKKLKADDAFRKNGCQGKIRELMKDFDFSNYGGAILLGIKGACIICHGDTSPFAIKNAIFQTNDFFDGDFTERFESEYLKSMELTD